MKNLWKAADAAAWGAVSFGGLLPYLGKKQREEIEALCPRPGGVFIAAFSYYAGNAPGNLALYCRGEDYHQVVTRRLEQVSTGLRERYPNNRFVSGADNSPVPERAAAVLAGLGVQGKSQLLFVPDYGSYVFLGSILTDLPLETTKPAGALPICQNSSTCQSCGACQKACPGKALTEDGFILENCISQITQKKGDLSPEEHRLVEKHPLIWGCDICQAVCPVNRSVQETGILEFRENLLPALGAEDLDGLSNRQFRDKYGNRAFAWRGVSLLQRNLSLQEQYKKRKP